jgi:hypothetical protein
VSTVSDPDLGVHGLDIETVDTQIRGQIGGGHGWWQRRIDDPLGNMVP